MLRFYILTGIFVNEIVRPVHTLFDMLSDCLSCNEFMVMLMFLARGLNVRQKRLDTCPILIQGQRRPYILWHN